jgi:hypothetical protein
LATWRSSGSRPSRRPRRLDTDSRYDDHAAASTHAGYRDPRRCVPHPFSLSCLDKIRLLRPNLCGSDREYNTISTITSRQRCIHQLVVTFEQTCRLFFLIQNRKRSSMIDYQFVGTTGTKSPWNLKALLVQPDTHLSSPLLPDTRTKILFYFNNQISVGKQKETARTS